MLSSHYKLVLIHANTLSSPRLLFSHSVNCVLYKNYPAARSCGQQTNNGPQPGERLTLFTITCYEMNRLRPGLLEWLFKNYDDTGRDEGS